MDNRENRVIVVGKFTGKRVGIIGGFGAYATLDFYSRLLDSFAVESERDYPNMIIDNVFSMPSRTRALLTGEGQTEIVETIVSSMKKILDYNVDCMVMVCGTAHYFLPYVYEKLPEAKDKVINILEATGKHLAANNIDKVLILAAEGTLKQKLYSRTLVRYNIACVEPKEQYWEEIRYFIECVKQNKYDNELKDRFLRFLVRYDVDNIILGCTEFPVLLRHIDMGEGTSNFYDPLTYAIQEIHRRIS